MGREDCFVQDAPDWVLCRARHQWYRPDERALQLAVQLGGTTILLGHIEHYFF